jgi:hypothetical protein
MPPIAFAQVADFTGGLNFRADQFQLAPNESPSMLNVEIDPRGGVFSRAGYKATSLDPIVSAGQTWNPKQLYNYKGTTPQIMLTTGYVPGSPSGIEGAIYHSSGGNFSLLTTVVGGVSVQLPVSNQAGASMTTWASTLYISPGFLNSNSYKWNVGDANATALTPSGPIWQPYAQPTGGYMPRASLCTVHANKMFVADTYENGTVYPNRLRWSHEGLPEDWFQDDYIDIEAGGQGIRGIYVVDGQLLIFKPKAIYLLMGYDADSFQLVELSTTLGIDYPTQAVAGNGGVYFFDYPNGLYFYSRNGITDLFERLRPMIINNEVNPSGINSISCSWVNQRLWLSMPYRKAKFGSAPTYPTVNFIFDPSIGRGRGAFTMFQTSPRLSDDATPVAIDGFGLVGGCDWRNAQDEPLYLMICPDDDCAVVYSVDDYDNVNDELWDPAYVNPAPEPPGAFVPTGKFNSNYTTSWFDDGRYVQLKTFTKPNYVFKETGQTTALSLRVYKDFNESNAIWTKAVVINGTNTGGLYGVSNYAEANYGAVTSGAIIKRTGISNLGRGYAIQLEFIGPTSSETVYPGRNWGLNSIAYKYKRRKVRGN